MKNHDRRHRHRPVFHWRDADPMEGHRGWARDIMRPDGSGEMLTYSAHTSPEAARDPRFMAMMDELARAAYKHFVSTTPTEKEASE